mgnify:CR=1 FL=1
MPSINAAIVVNHLSKIVDSSESALTILQQISFAIPEGDSVAIIGSSGSGKSTVLRCIAGLEAPTGGKIAINEYSHGFVFSVFAYKEIADQ